MPSVAVENKRAVVLWTGGKDCNLALHEAKKSGYEIIRLITFAMVGNTAFRAHPIPFLKLQAEALGIPHGIISVHEPYEAGYENAIAEIKHKLDIHTIVTGDISEIHNNSNWITDRSKPAGVNVLLPLWHIDRRQLLQRVIALNFKIIFSCVKEPWFTSDWLGKEINTATIEELECLHQLNGMDICGEQGEYHTLVLDGPNYKYNLQIEQFNSIQENEIMYMQMERVLKKRKDLV